MKTMNLKQYDKVNTRWKLTNDETTTVSEEFYTNTLEAVTFFRNLGGSEKVEHKNDKVIVTSVSPDRKIKIVREFIK